MEDVKIQDSNQAHALKTDAEQSNFWARTDEVSLPTGYQQFIAMGCWQGVSPQWDDEC